MDEVKTKIDKLINVLVGESFDGGLIKKVNDNCGAIASLKATCAAVQQKKKGRRNLQKRS